MSAPHKNPAAQPSVLVTPLSGQLLLSDMGRVLAAVVTRVMSSLLFAVSALDSLTFAASIVLILCAGAAACLLPAWRASRVDPLTALRRAV